MNKKVGKRGMRKPAKTHLTAKKQAKTVRRRKRPTTAGGCFKPGRSDNPNGRPKGGSSLSPLLKDSLDAGHATKRGLSNGEVIAEALVSKAARENIESTKVVLDRIEGKPRQRIDVGGPDGGAIPISIADTLGFEPSNIRLRDFIEMDFLPWSREEKRS